MDHSAVKIIDRFIGTPLILVLWLFKLFKKPSKKIEKILIIMFWGIGSNIYVLPCIKALKEKFPNAELTILAPEKNKDLFYKNKNIHNKIFADLSLFALIKQLFQIRNKYDLVIDYEHWLNISAIIAYVAGKRRIGFANKLRALLYNDKVQFNKDIHSVHNNTNLLKPLGIDTKPETENIKTSEHDKDFIRDFFAKNKLSKNDFIIGVCPSSGPTVISRRWPKDRFISLADNLIEEHNAKVILTGSEDERELLLNIRNQMKHKPTIFCGAKLSHLIELINNCSIFISNDTGPMHIAANQEIKTIGLFGPETPVIFGPFGKHTFSIFKGIECSPCIKIYKGKHINCKENICMKMITVEEVLEAVKNLTKHPQPTKDIKTSAKTIMSNEKRKQ
tara:strand:+ start:546 stop:1718 length:1173 start_codon:yes stop_codon:yes gene_type:complete